MTRNALIDKLDYLANSPVYDPEAMNNKAIDCLLAYIGDADVTAAFNRVPAL